MGGLRAGDETSLARGDSSRHRLINLVGIALFALGSAVVLTRLWWLGDRLHGFWLLSAAAVGAALLFSDFVSGLVHWAADNWGTEDWPFVGAFVQPFRDHHSDPAAMTRHGFVERHGNNCVISLPMFLLALFVGDTASSSFFWAAFCLATAWWVLATNQFHAWAHMERVPRAVRLLQRLRLILPPEHHARHHQPPYAQNYCITTGWLDAPLRAIRFWPALEWLLTKLTGVEPEHRRQLSK